MKINIKVAHLSMLLFAMAIGTGCDHNNGTWIEYGNNGIATVYFKVGSISKSGNRTMWTMVSDLLPEAHSIKMETEYDCKIQMSKIIYTMSFSEPMGEGRLTSFQDRRGIEVTLKELRHGVSKSSLNNSSVAYIQLDADEKLGATRIWIFSDESGEWKKKETVPNSLEEHLWKLACPAR